MSTFVFSCGHMCPRLGVFSTISVLALRQESTFDVVLSPVAIVSTVSVVHYVLGDLVGNVGNGNDLKRVFISRFFSSLGCSGSG